MINHDNDFPFFQNYLSVVVWLQGVFSSADDMLNALAIDPFPRFMGPSHAAVPRFTDARVLKKDNNEALCRSMLPFRLQGGLRPHLGAAWSVRRQPDGRS